MIRHFLSCMASHSLVITPVPKMVIMKINAILSSFFWRESNGRGKIKWGAWSKICKLVEEGGVGLGDLNDVKKSFHMKFVWHLMTIENLWTCFFELNTSKLATYLQPCLQWAVSFGRKF